MRMEITLFGSDEKAITQVTSKIVEILERSGVNYKKVERARTIELLGDFRIYKRRIAFDPMVYPDRTKRIVKILGDYKDKIQVEIKFV